MSFASGSRRAELDITKHVKELRQQLGLNQQQFAEMIGVSQSTVSKWEKGAQRPDLESVVKMQVAGGAEPSRFAANSSHKYDRASWGVEVPVIGAINEGRWGQDYRWHESNNFSIRAPKRSSWADLDMMGFVVEDESASPIYPSESILVCARLNVKVWQGPRTGDHLVIAQRDDTNGSVRVVVRQLAIGRQNEIVLTSFNSVEPASHKPLTMAGRMDLLAAGGYAAFGMLGIILGGFIVENPKRFSDPSSA